MSRSTGIVILVVILGAILLAVLLSRSAAPPHSEPALAAGISLTGYTTSGAVSWVVHAASASYKDSTSVLESPEIVFNQDGAPEVSIRGERLVRTPTTSEIQGETQIERQDGLRLMSQDLQWDERNDVLESAAIRVEFEDSVLTAGSFHHDLEASRSEFSDGVELTLVHDGEDVRASADSAEERDGWFALVDNVDVTVSSGETYACERLESTLAGDLIRLSGPVAGTWDSGTFSAVVVELDKTGFRAQGDVHVTLDLSAMGGADGT